MAFHTNAAPIINYNFGPIKEFELITCGMVWSLKLYLSENIWKFAVKIKKYKNTQCDKSGANKLLFWIMIDTYRCFHMTPDM